MDASGAYPRRNARSPGKMPPIRISRRILPLVGLDSISASPGIIVGRGQNANSAVPSNIKNGLALEFPRRTAPEIGGTEMSRRPAKFTQSDVKRVLKAVLDTGHKGIVHLATDGSISILPPGTEPAPKENDPWEQAIAELGQGQ
jgi:hypothetical protein